ncbi:MAG TPA: hypothetical protein VHQ39_01430 [Dongiaceae bacterium]|nr:hypothetical protein [Dongiaceae bacterium]
MIHACTMEHDDRWLAGFELPPARGSKYRFVVNLEVHGKTG